MVQSVTTDRVSGVVSSTITQRFAGTPAVHTSGRLGGFLLLSGDMTDGDDRILLSGDMGDGNDSLRLSGVFYEITLTAPSVAKDAGYTTLAFSDDFDSLSTIDTTASDADGFKWYTDIGYGQGHTNANNLSVSNSVLTIGGGTGRAQIISAMSKVASPYYRGHIFRGGYFETRLRFNPARGTAASSGLSPISYGLSAEVMIADQVSTAADWPGQAAGYQHYPELDFIEAYRSAGETYAGKTHYLATIHDWSILPDLSVRNTYNRDLFFQVGTVKWDVFQTYGCLWVPQSGTTPGYVQWFFNGRAGLKTYFLGPVGSPPLPGYVDGDDPVNRSSAALATRDFAVLDSSAGLAIRLETDTNWPMEVDWFRLWQ